MPGGVTWSPRSWFDRRDAIVVPDATTMGLFLFVLGSVTLGFRTIILVIPDVISSGAFILIVPDVKASGAFFFILRTVALRAGTVIFVVSTGGLLRRG